MFLLLLLFYLFLVMFSSPCFVVTKPYALLLNPQTPALSVAHSPTRPVRWGAIFVLIRAHFLQIYIPTEFGFYFITIARTDLCINNIPHPTRERALSSGIPLLAGPHATPLIIRSRRATITDSLRLPEARA